MARSQYPFGPSMDRYTLRGELSERAVVKEYLTTAEDGKNVPNVHLFFDDGYFIPWMAYMLTWQHSRDKLEREYQSSIKAKGAPL